MHSSNKSKKKKKEIKIKIEKDDNDLKAMSHYIDDRGDLIKQIFSTLKTKTIRNLAPESLKKSSIEEIKELCLNEILGISKKRLLSIINATKCPTDTESSSDSDVHNIEEHISLEEISSDTDEDNAKRKEAKKLTKKGKKTNIADPVKKDDDDKEISVLELLELQARARAIRSQLALEPITKIEVDSDESDPNNLKKIKKITETEILNNKKDNDTSITNNNNKDIESKKLKISTEINGNTETDKEKSIQNPPRKIKLKRNFRKPQQQNDSENEMKDDKVDDKIEEIKTNNFKENTEIDKKLEENIEKTLLNEEEKNSNSTKNTKTEEIKIDEKRKSPSPDVVTILPSPETFFISDSSDDDDDDDDKMKNKKTKTITKSAIDKQMNSENQIIQKEINVSEKTKIIEDSLLSKSQEEVEEEEQANKIPVDIEEGEILDNEDNENDLKNELSKENDDEDKGNCSEEEIANKNENSEEKLIDDKLDKNKNEENERNSDEQNDDNPNDDVISLGNDIDYEIRDDLDEQNLNNKIQKNQEIHLIDDGLQLENKEEDEVKISKSKHDSNSNSADDADDNDDEAIEKLIPISLNENSSKNTTKSSDEEDEIVEEKEHYETVERMDYIELHDSSEEELETNSQNLEESNQSWNERWLRSRKVEKILAQSRLSNRVRDKIKKNKKIEQKITNNEEIIIEIKKDDEKFESKFEDGSVEQYKEIIQRQKSNINSSDN